jgi:hypothetical protein
LPVRISASEVNGRQPGRWVLARDLRAGDELLLRHHGVIRLESIQFDDLEESVYNFHVAELQNYAVGRGGILVHNTNEASGSSDAILNEINNYERAIEDATQGLAEAEAQYAEATAAGDYETAAWLAKEIAAGEAGIQEMLQWYGFLLTL